MVEAAARRAALVAQLKIPREPERDKPMTAGRPYARWIISTAALLAVLAASGYGLARLQPVAVRTAAAVPVPSGAQAAVKLEASGFVVARRMATVSSKVTGQVRDIMIEEGQRVTAGEVIARLDPSNAQAALDQAIAQAQSVAAAQRVAAVALEDAEAKHRRSTALLQAGFISEAAAETARTARDTAREKLGLAQREVATANTGIVLARRAREDTVVRAPFAGVVTVKAAQPGEIVSPISAGGGFTRTGIGTIVDMDSLEVQVDVAESFISRLSPGMPATVTLSAYPDWAIPAELLAIIPTADRNKATVAVRIALKMQDPRIVPEMAAQVAFLSAQPPARVAAPAVVLPVAALRASATGDPYVLVVEDGRARRRAVKLGRRSEQGQQVVAGLRSGELTVVDGADVRDGARVRAQR